MSSTPVPLSKRGDPWFDDGNIILLIESDQCDDGCVAFKVHRGVLSRHSEVFRSMFEMPQPESESDILDGCQVVRMYDLPVELSNLIKALYDGVIFNHRDIRDFFFLAGILRLATKYFISHLRSQAIRHLTQTWAYTLRGHDEMVSLAVTAPMIDDTTYPYVHPLHVLNLAREVNVRITVPSTLYFLSIYPLEDILRGDHLKLIVEHPSRPSSRLSIQDIQDYTLMYQHRITLILDFIRKTCDQRTQDTNCQNPKGQCTRVFSKLAYNISQSFTLKTGPFHNMRQAIQWVEDDLSICGVCKRSFKRDVTELRERLWNELPKVVGLPSWEELVTMDLPA